MGLTCMCPSQHHSWTHRDEANTSWLFCCLIQQPWHRMLCPKVDPSFPSSRITGGAHCLGWQDLLQLLLVGNCRGWCTNSTCTTSPEGFLLLLFLLWQHSGPRSAEDSCSVIILTRCQNFPEKYKAEMGNVDLTQLITQTEQTGGSWEQGKACLRLQGFCPCQNSKVLFQTIEILLLVLKKATEIKNLWETLIMENVSNIKLLDFIDKKTRWSPNLCEITLQWVVLNYPNTYPNTESLPLPCHCPPTNCFCCLFGKGKTKEWPG